ncbi:hypothetical protein POSPLADRAFT_1041613 [Postia placenta MAD-698-R-SB12]|uniref:Uncharacterized protein n=1 Tax=Postia placenta MAD-698-R-SB12 TaxID=670580 RepID=A0A1X6MN15_9APHY|nr:hypothetical protein POSPLADRAFT_1041613 [Postia placenta MAD-698-R-SB12]OSX57755.1 hypothetical protein POSPLADRAFT_1041613 [Postia placenta MAD-698-R-SB12]
MSSHAPSWTPVLHGERDAHGRSIIFRGSIPDQASAGIGAQNVTRLRDCRGGTNENFHSSHATEPKGREEIMKYNCLERSSTGRQPHPRAWSVREETRGRSNSTRHQKTFGSQ